MARNKKIQNLLRGDTKTFKTILQVLVVILLLLILICVFKTCIECSPEHQRKKIIDRTGYLPDNENWDNIHNVIPPFHDNDLDSLPNRVSLENFFPPIGKQGNYGTCVAWAVGYNLKTALNAIDNHWTHEQLDSAIYQTSPKDLWLSIPRSQKGQSCEGTCFEPAFEALMSDGVATMQAVPYQNLGSCNGKKTGDSNNKLVSFSRVIADSVTLIPKTEQIKAYLNAGTPLVLGAKLGDRFMNWSSGDVINFDTYNSPEMMHAVHAMVLTGYDDSKNAFRVRNSWGKEWGDEGSIWVDYQFFSNSFCVAVFVAQNKPI